ncbi:inactive carboxylesterase 4 [Thozetella sp. PMI_491]|nr:inactive carboxylesterase 4 [Thozetella sp. PMI_491]
MSRLVPFLVAVVAAAGPVTALPAENANLTVDLGYGVYTGVNNPSTNLNVWKGIRYAAPPLGELRWQAPQPPVTNRTPVLANTFGPACFQTPSHYTGAAAVLSTEDCLYLNVFSPATSSNNAKLPVIVWIHGGGYGQGDAIQQDSSAFINTNDNGLLVVNFQYRLGAFGFAASPAIKSKGVLNAGLLDQRAVLEWVQKNIVKFGGDPDRVTIAGESAGAGSAMLHALAQNGELGTKLFKNIIAASPWVPTQPYYDDAISVRHYEDFAAVAGCNTKGEDDEEKFDCLLTTDTRSLQAASWWISTHDPTPQGNWAFIPVTDGSYVTGPPSVTLSQQKRFNGLRNNANEGSLIPPTGINTEKDLIAWLKNNFFKLSDENVTQILAAYPSTSAPVNAADPKFETNGRGPPTAVNVSQVATGQQQRAYNIYAEASVVCHSYWFASAFSTAGLAAWHYQYSVPFAVHGADLTGYWGPPTDNQGPDLVTAFRKIFGNFAIHDDPSISDAVANGPSALNTSIPNPASNWPRWNQSNPMLLNLNQTGGTPYKAVGPTGATLTQFRQPGLRNDFSLARADTWEGGRGQRCEFWKKLSPYVPQ